MRAGGVLACCCLFTQIAGSSYYRRYGTLPTKAKGSSFDHLLNQVQTESKSREIIPKKRYSSIQKDDSSFYVLRHHALQTAQKYTGSTCPFRYTRIPRNSGVEPSFYAKRKNLKRRRVKGGRRRKPGSRRRIKGGRRRENSSRRENSRAKSSEINSFKKFKNNHVTKYSYLDSSEFNEEDEFHDVGDYSSIREFGKSHKAQPQSRYFRHRRETRRRNPYRRKKDRRKTAASLSKYGPRQHVWIKLKIEAADRRRCNDQVMSWNCVVQLKYKTRGVQYNFTKESARCFKDKARCDATFGRRIN